MKVEIYSDVVCPWCYIGKRRFEKAIAGYPGGEDIEVVFRPFQLDPSAPRGVPSAEYLQKRFGASASQMTGQVGTTAAAEGIQMNWDRMLMSNTLLAHTLVDYVEREHGVAAQKQLIDRLFAAHFTDGLDVADTEVLVRLASEVGADSEAVRRLIENPDAPAAVQREISEAREMGIKSVPTFVFDGLYMVEGAQSPAVFRQVLEQVTEKARQQTES
jgi:predicted DsbA family dithiol-disulfide isomerase